MAKSRTLVPEADREYFAAFLDLKGRNGLVVGGGPVAAQKAETLLRSGARVTVVAPELCPRLSELTVVGALRHEPRRFQPGDLVGAEIVIAATDDPAVNESVYSAARSLKVPVNVADSPALCSFIMPSVVDRPPVQIAISTAGASPVLARKLRTIIEQMVPFTYGRLASLARRFRAASKTRFPEAEARRRFWERVVDGPIGDLVLAGREASAVEALEAELAGKPESEVPPGMVYLVGGGPGRPDLLTLRALRVMQLASVVLYDNLVAPAILDLVRREAERIYVGKERDRHALPQDDINALMVKLAREGKRVVRLKGGDPFIFGRGGEEIETLAAHGVPFEVVPGITAASGAAAYAGIPLTHRDHAHSCIFVTGHLKETSLSLDWSVLARPDQTLAVYMGVKGIAVICAKLVEHGLPGATPAAIVERATHPDQRVIVGTLADLPQRAERAELRPPSIMIIGHVVSLRGQLGWYTPGTLDIGPQPPEGPAAETRARAAPR